MSDDEYYKYFHGGVSHVIDENSFLDEFIEDVSNTKLNATIYVKTDNNDLDETIKFDEPKPQTSDEIGKDLLKDVIGDQLDKEWDMEKIIMKYQLSPEQLDKILYESQGWESQIIGGESPTPNKNLIFGGEFDPENFEKLVNIYLDLFEITTDFLTRYLRTFQIIVEIDKNGGENKFLPNMSLTEKENEEILSSFLKIVEEIRGNAEVPLKFTDVKINIDILNTMLSETGLQHHNESLTKLIKDESTLAFESLKNAAKNNVKSQRAFINEIYKYDLRQSNRFYSNGIHKNAIDGFGKYKKFINNTTESLGENFINIVISIYKILTRCMFFYQNSIDKTMPTRLQKYFSKIDVKAYPVFLEKVRNFLKNPQVRNVQSAKNLIEENVEIFGIESNLSSKNEPAEQAEPAKTDIKSEIKQPSFDKCFIPPEGNISGYLNIIDFIEETKPEKVEEIVKDEKQEIEPKSMEEIKEIEEIVKEFKEDKKEIIKEEPFDIMHMITDSSTVTTLITPVPDAPTPPSITVFKKFLVTKPQPVPVPPIAPPITDFKKFVVTKPAAIPVPPPPPIIKGFRPLVLPPKQIITQLGSNFMSTDPIAINKNIDDSSVKIPVEYRVLPKLSEKKDPYRVKVMFIIAYNILQSGNEIDNTLANLAKHSNSFSRKTDDFLNNLILKYINAVGFTYASDDALFVYVKYLKNGGIPLIAREDIYNFVKAYDMVVEKLYNLGV